jgi:hypothetical protein
LVADIDNVTVDEDADEFVVGDLEDFFSDIEEDGALSFAKSGDSDELNMTIDEDNILRFTPSENYNDAEGDVITITASDSEGGSVETTFTVIVTPVNDEPFVDVAIEALTVNEDEEFHAIADLDEVFGDIDFGDQNPDSHVFTINDLPDELQASIDDDNVLSIDPIENYNLPDGIEVNVTATDNGNDFAVNTFSLTVAAVNDDPFVADAIEDQVVNEDDGLFVIADLDDVFGDIDFGDQNPDSHVFTMNELPEELQASIDDENVLSINPVADYNLEDGVDITITATDIEGATFDDDFNLIVTPVNDDPIIIAGIDDVVVNEDSDETIIAN